eukprot:10000326-Karenia_brevis.AAC.1
MPRAVFVNSVTTVVTELDGAFALRWDRRSTAFFDRTSRSGVKERSLITPTWSIHGPTWTKATSNNSSAGSAEVEIRM